ncbi:MAG: hypothetical protein WCI04_02490 [archaeon]
MWAIIQGLHLINNQTINTQKGIPNTRLHLTDLDQANEAEYYIAFTQKNASVIGNKIITRAQMYALISNTKTELYKAYSKFISENYKDTGINFTDPNPYLGGK